ncbi:ABC transporter ATP-binding protein [Hymenobacter busanensis]|uniref:ABC transporter ATP-binding protein n=1 Tax=Hymenobacter busanensis TaxID=2607656 RepID=A0A7L4ZYN7_9BACT|nr:ABC transporter ATP-binding protein [Hymenobacter busanensis]KAA9332321.1 ABC transporter ATP-binding protein [Hymenobacter busanensis]QHJ07342.1 ATP-binding cassette domain-containing protein [Hymenobacter busanensis]
MNTVQLLARLSRYVFRYAGQLVFLIIIGLLGVVFEVLKPLPIKLVIDNVLGSQPVPALLTRLTGPAAFVHDKSQLLLALVVFTGVVTIGGAVFSAAVVRLTVALGRKLVYDLSLELYRKLQQMSLTFYAQNKLGDLLTRITGDVFVVYFVVAQIIVPAIISVVCMGAMLYVMVQLDLVLALIAISVVPLLILALALFFKPMDQTTAAQFARQGELSAFVQQSLTGIKTIQSFAREQLMFQKLEQQAADFGNAFQKATVVGTTYNQLTALITGLAAAALLGVGAYRGLQGHLTAGDLFIFIGYVSALYAPVNALSTAVGAAIAVVSRSRRVFEILDSEDVVPEVPGAVALDASGLITFHDVSFGYATSSGPPREVLQGISFQVLPGQVIAIVGPTGAGKTSIISLLLRFYDPWRGHISLDGLDLRELQLQSLRENMSLVLQEPLLFPISILDNIRFGNPEATMEEVVEAAQAAQAHDFIRKLPDGYDTVVGELSATLSGGEKQRIAIARAFLKKAPILILDEPTSALDSLTEARIFKALDRFAQRKTVFIISHKFSTIRHADQIVIIKDGQVAEHGTHQDLLARGEVYADLYKHQHIS